MPTGATSLQHSTRTIRQSQKNPKNHPYWKRIKINFTDDTIFLICRKPYVFQNGGGDVLALINSAKL
jgi:hypothetical protein